MCWSPTVRKAKQTSEMRWSPIIRTANTYFGQQPFQQLNNIFGHPPFEQLKKFTQCHEIVGKKEIEIAVYHLQKSLFYQPNLLKRD